MRGYPVAFTVTERQKPYPTCSIRQMPTPTDRCRIGVAKGAPVSFVAQTRYEYAPFRRPKTVYIRTNPSRPSVKRVAIARKSGSSLAVKFLTPVEFWGMPLPWSHHCPSVGYGEAAIEKIFSTAVEFPTPPPPCVLLIQPN